MRKNILHQPQAYKKGYIEFYKLRFKVTKDVLIPRPETELLVDEVLNFIQTNHKPKTCLPADMAHNLLTILDLGTGSGNIAISLAKNLSNYLPTSDVGTQIIATDISEEALGVAKQNAKLHGVEDKISFYQINLLSDINCFNNTSFHPRGGNSNDKNYQDIDIIVTNLPYIPTQRIPYLDPSVKDFEPHIALDGGVDGFELYRKLFTQIKKKGLKPKLILGEIDYTHGELAQTEAQKYFPEAFIEIKTDLAHKQRILIIKG